MISLHTPSRSKAKGALIVILLLTTKANAPSVLMPQQGIPAFRVGDAHRGSLVKEAQRHLNDTLRAEGDSHIIPCFMAADFTANEECQREVTVVVPLQNLSHRSQLTLATAWGWEWVTSTSLQNRHIGRHAAAATIAAASMSSTSPQATIPLRQHAGVGNAFSLARPPKARQEPEGAWVKKVKDVKQASSNLITALSSTTGPHAEYCATWADRVVVPASVEIPQTLRGAATRRASKHLDTKAFTNRYTTPTTKRHSPNRRHQQSTFKPTSLKDILTEKSISQLQTWLKAVSSDLHCMKSNQDYKRKVSKPLVITQRGVRERAQGVIWDLRTRHHDDLLIPQGYFKTLDTATTYEPLLDANWLASVLGPNFKDQELMGFIKDGVSFKIDLPLATVLFPHSTSLPTGYTRVEKELRRFLDLEWYSEWFDPPFWPIRTLPQGVVERKFEIGRPRRTTNGSAPHDSFTVEGVLIESTNAAIDIKHNCDTPEIKPRIEDTMQDDEVLRRAAEVWKEPFFNFTDDAKDYYMHLRLHPTVVPFSCLLWTPLSMSQADRDNFVAFIVETVLGFGISASSNIAQRLSWALIKALRAIMDAAEKPFFDKEKDPHRVAWIKTRRKLTATTGEEQCRLYNVHMYTDDPIFSVVGVERTIRLLICWRETTQGVRLRMAVAAKREAGCGVTWLGHKFHGDFGAITILQQKRLRALKGINEALHEQEPKFKDYRSLVGLLQHFTVATANKQSVMYGLYGPHKAQLAPNQRVSFTQYARQQLGEWSHILSTSSGASYDSAVTTSATLINAATDLALYSDACKADAEYPGIGGCNHGLWWYISLKEAGIAHLPIPQLELIAVVVNIILMAPYVGTARAACYSDSLTSTLALQGDRASAETMQIIHSAMLATPLITRILPQLVGAHVYGESNPMADLASRGLFTQLQALAAALGVPLRRLILSKEARVFIRYVAHKTRPLSETEQGRGSPFSANTEGDGPTSLIKNQHRPPISPWSDSTKSAQHSKGPGIEALHRKRPAQQRVNFQLDDSRATSNSQPRQRRHPPPRRAQTKLPEPSPRNDRGTTSHHQHGPYSPPHAHLIPRESGRTRDTSFTYGDPQWQVHPPEPARLNELWARVESAVQHSVPPNSSAQLKSAWIAWEACAKRLGFAPWRLDHDANTGADRAGWQREVLIQCVALLDVYEHMKPRRKADAAAKPQSALAILSSVRRMHALRSPPTYMVKAPAISACLKSMLTDFVEEHGPEALMPHRKEPIANTLMNQILSVSNNTRLTARTRLDWGSLEYIGLKAAMCTAKQAGFRKAEATVKTQKTRVTQQKARRCGIRWRINGVTTADPSREQLESLREGDCAILTPPPSKADRFGLVWGMSPIYLPFRNTLSNAAKALRDMEIAMPCHGADRTTTFMFTTNAEGAPLTESFATTSLTSLLTAVGGETLAGRHSFHSFRIALACELLASGASEATIQALCRWKSADSLRIYARLNPEDYITWIMHAASADATSVRIQSLPAIDEDRSIGAIAPLLNALDIA
jgi:hypothetical protein